ncbi:SRPBCC domain-containing protein [Aurantibacillus circumpalustris]|uniref:SRPBCC domain-containing protein n=1 Tax=Aurantibacillus circumpalustris TaxID=3036359 RepID=UPI00295B6A2B|nr:SRPBCC domain-containing protein [Aurantibacillus circumpalustris]
MQNQDYTTSILVEKSPEVAFGAIKNVSGWWSEEIEGKTNQLNDVFDYHFEDVHRCRMKLVELVTNKKVVWLVEENYFKFTKDKSEWIGTKVCFDISSEGDKTKISFTHFGLVPEYECFEICKGAWTTYITKSLRDLIVTGKGQPNAAGKPRTEDEKKLGQK